MNYDPVKSSLSKESIAAADLVRMIASDDDGLNHDTVEGETDLFEAIARAIDVIDECDIIKAGCDAKIEELKGRSFRADVRAKSVRSAIEQAMLVAGISTAKLPLATITVRSIAPKPRVSDDSLIPARFWKAQPPKLDMSLIKSAFGSEDIPGIEPDNGGVSLQIRRK